jgi:hypothetical protein
VAHQAFIGRLLWEGKYREAVEALRPEYQRDPVGKFVPWVSALYSAQALHPEYRAELKQLLPNIRTYVPDRLHLVPRADNDEGQDVISADDADVLSTVMLSLSDDFAYELKKCRQLVLQASQLAAYGECLAKRQDVAPHTLPLLLLTHAEALRKLRELELLQLGTSDLPDGRKQLCKALERVPQVTHLEQKERVLRKLGVEFRRHGDLMRSIRYGVTALRVPHKAWGVKVKSLAALVGYGL